MAALDKVAGEVEKDYGTLNVPWGEVLRFRRGNVDLPGNGAPSPMGAIRTISVGPFVNGKSRPDRGDTFFAVIEFFNTGARRGLLSYGNWSKTGSPHVEDQMQADVAKRRCGRSGGTAKRSKPTSKGRRSFRRLPSLSARAVDRQIHGVARRLNRQAVGARIADELRVNLVDSEPHQLIF